MRAPPVLPTGHRALALVDNRRLAVKSSAKLISSYIFKELSDDNSSSITINSTTTTAAASVETQRWSRYGRRPDPMIPSSAEAWPALRKNLRAVLTSWWGANVATRDVQATLDQLLYCCRQGAKAVAGEARRSVLSPEWTDEHTKVRACGTGRDTAVILRYDGGNDRRIGTQRYQFMKRLYGQYLAQVAPEEVVGSMVRLDQINTRIYNVLTRYETLSRFDQGTQGALPPAAFKVLQSEWGVNHECFASPLNCTLNSYNSLFPDVDGCFGSLGSFFDFFPEHGAHEANPPFDVDSVNATFQHIQRVMVAARDRWEQQRIGTHVVHETAALLFFVVSPFVPPAVVSDEFVIRQVELAAAEHSYTLGMKHRGGAKDQLWQSSGKTVLSFIGNAAATVKWPITDAKLAMLRVAFR